MAEDYNFLSRRIIECCMVVHRELGPGLLESVYEICTERAMTRAGLKVSRQVSVPLIFQGEALNKTFVIDMLVNDRIILELKSVETLLPIHEAQLVTYLKLADKKLGLLINFNEKLLKEGIRRKINGNIHSM